MNTIGIDISKEWSRCLCTQRQRNRRFTNNQSGWKAFKDWIIDEDVHVIMEASGPYYLGLASYLYEQRLTVSVVNPLVIRRYGQMKLARIKTDANDAGLIAQYGIDSNQSGGVLPLKPDEA